MIKKIIFLLIACQLSFAGFTFAQKATTPKNNQISNEKYITHKTTGGETIFSICKKYNIEQKELLDANPSLRDGLKAGLELSIPVKDSKKKGKEKKVDEFITHKVKPKETLFSISKKYNVPVDKIIKFNPDAKDGVKTNQVIKIPVLVSETESKNENGVKKEVVKMETTNYEVEEGDTFFGLLRKFGVTKDQLLSVNQGMSIDIKVGQSVKIPKITSNAGSSQGKYIEHKVEPGETIYGLATEYDVKVFEIVDINPGLQEHGLEAGQTINIPRVSTIQSSNNPVKEVKPTVPVSGSKVVIIPKARQTVASAKDTFKITMFLPLFLRENFLRNSNGEVGENGDSIKIVTEDANRVRSVYEPSKEFLCFYEGFLTALDTMKKTGINISLDVYDNQFKQAVVDSVMRKQGLADADLIVGPVDVRSQKNISNYSYKNQIPLVSPFSSDDDYVNSNPFYFQVNPTRDYVYKKTAEFIGREYWNRNVIILTPNGYEQLPGADIVELVRERLRSNSSKNGGGAIHISKVSIGEGYYEIKDNLSKENENVIFLLPPKNKTEREAILSRAINNLYTLSDEYKVTLVGMSEYLGYRSINTEYYHKLNFHCLYLNFIDYKNQEVNSFIRNYRQKYKTEPTQFSYRGYDIAKYFLEAYRTNGKSYINKISSLQINTLQTKFRFRRVKDFSGFMNRSLNVIEYTPDFDVKVDYVLTD